MAGLNGLTLPRERDQFAALFEMRWRLFVRNMQRDEQKVSFMLWLTGRVLIFCFSVGAGCIAAFVTYITLIGKHIPLSLIFNFVFVAWQLLNLFRGSLPQGAEAELYRFPLRFRTYVLLWLSAGVLEGLTLMGTWISLGIFVGLVLGGLHVLRSGLVVLLFYAVNLLMTRTVFLWLGRMLASRRARDFVLVLSSLLSVGPQLLRMHHERIAAWMHRLPLPPWVFTLVKGTPGYLATSALQSGHGKALLSLLAWDVVIAAALLFGLHRAFRGDETHEFAASAPAKPSQRKLHSSQHSGSLITAVAGCEWARLRHGGSAIYAALSPLLYVVVFGLRLAKGAIGPWIVPAAAMYIALGLRWFNVFGQDGPGVQTYLLAPVPLRTVLLGKNLFAIVLYTAQVLVCGTVLTLVAGRISPSALLYTLVWIVFYASAAFALGNARSLQTPAFIATDKVTLRDARRARRSGAGWIGLVLVFGGAGLGAGIAALCTWLHHAAWAPILLLPVAIASVLAYLRSLRNPAFSGDIAAAEPLLLRVAKAA